MKRSVLIIGNYCQTITVIRSLGQAGYRVIAGRGDEHAYTEYSRYTAEVWRHPAIEKSEAAFVAALQKFLSARRDVELVYPIGSGEVLCLVRHADAIRAALIMADPAAVVTCVDKLHMYQVAADLGIPRAESRKAASYHELVSAVTGIGYPCVIKPNNSQTPFFEQKAVILRCAADLPRLLPTWPHGAEFLLVQRFTPGYRHNCHFLADRGHVLAYFEQRVLRTDMPNGTGYGVHGVSWAPTPQLRDYCGRLLHRLNYSGVGCVQFLVDDESGTVNFLEINPRLDATCAVPFYCGYDFPRMAALYTEYRRGTLAQPPTHTEPYPIGKHGVSLWRDIHGWREAMKRKELDRESSRAWLREACRTLLRGDFHLTWSWKDPLPTCYRYGARAAAIFLAMLVGFASDDS